VSIDGNSSAGTVHVKEEQSKATLLAEEAMQAKQQF
jgi:hypothetical protein